MILKVTTCSWSIEHSIISDDFKEMDLTKKIECYRDTEISYYEYNGVILTITLNNGEKIVLIKYHIIDIEYHGDDELCTQMITDIKNSTIRDYKIKDKQKIIECAKIDKKLSKINNKFIDVQDRTYA